MSAAPEPDSESTRTFDIVLVGATGFAGGLTAEYLAAHVPDGCRWAIAGRSAAKLAAVAERLAPAAPARVVCDLTDAAAVTELAASTRVLATTVGPYLLYGESLVAACAEAGTDYLDLTGEPEFVDRMYLGYHHRATATGARLVHCCGFDSIPHDLGAFYTVGQFSADIPIAISGYVRSNGRMSGGTYQSALNAFSRVRKAGEAAKERKRREPRPQDRRARAVPGKPHRIPGSSMWAAPLPTIDPQVVARSARALPRYGPDFSYSHFAAMRHLRTLVGAAAGLGSVLVLAQIPPAKRLLLRRMAPGSGPSPEQRARSWFRVRFVADGGGKRIVTQVSGGDPGYTATAAMLAESALCLAFDELPETSGQVTTAVAMGQALIDRLEPAGITFEVLGG